MAVLIQTIHLTTDKKKFYPLLNMVQDDNNRMLICTVDDYTVPDTASVRLYFQSPENILTYVDGIVEVGNATFNITKQCLTSYGMYAAQLLIREGDKDLKTYKFAIDVEAAAYGVPISEEDQSNIQQILDEMDALVAQAEESVEKIQNLSVSATSLPSDSSATATKIINPDGSVRIQFGIPRGHDGDISFIIVSSLPIIGEEGKVYLVPSSDPKAEDSFEEWAFIEGAWERLGGVRIDLSDYATKEDLASRFNGTYFRVDSVNGTGDSRLSNSTGSGLSIGQSDGINLASIEGPLNLHGSSLIELNAVDDETGVPGEILSTAELFSVENMLGEKRYFPELYCGAEGNPRFTLVPYSQKNYTIQNPLSSAGSYGFYFDQHSSSGTGIDTFRLVDRYHNPVDIENVIEVGDFFSCKADYSWSFAGTVHSVQENGDIGKITVIYRKNPPPSTFLPDEHLIGSEELGYIWFPNKPLAGGETNGVVIGVGAVALGTNNKANEMGALAVGRDNLVDGRYGFSSGLENEVGYCGFSSGIYCSAKGLYSTAIGYRTTADENHQFARGRNSVPMPSNYLDIVGYGSSATKRKNIYVLDNAGNLHVSGDIFANATSSDCTDGSRLAKESDLAGYATQEWVNAKNYVVGPVNSSEIQDGAVTNAKVALTKLNLDSSSTLSANSLCVAGKVTVTGNRSLAIGGSTAAINDWVEGTTAAVATLWRYQGNVFMSIASGNTHTPPTTITGEASDYEYWLPVLFVKGTGDAVIGSGAISGSNSSSVGQGNFVKSNQSFVTGARNFVNATNTLTAGSCLVNTKASSTVLGAWNKPTNDIFVIGYGSNAQRFNITTIDGSGNLHVKGKIYQNATNDECSNGNPLIDSSALTPYATKEWVGQRGYISDFDDSGSGINISSLYTNDYGTMHLYAYGNRRRAGIYADISDGAQGGVDVSVDDNSDGTTSVTTKHFKWNNETVATQEWVDKRVSLLWENPDPTAEFGQTNVTLSDNLSNYRMIIVNAGIIYNGQKWIQSSCTCPADFFSCYGLDMTGRGNASMAFYTRDFAKVSDTVIQFHVCRLNSVTKATGVWASETTPNNMMIPFTIYGVK